MRGSSSVRRTPPPSRVSRPSAAMSPRRIVSPSSGNHRLKVRRCSDRELLLMGMAICSLSMIATHWAFHLGATVSQGGSGESNMDSNNNDMQNTPSSAEKRPRHRRTQQAIVLDMGLPPDAVTEGEAAVPMLSDSPSNQEENNNRQQQPVPSNSDDSNSYNQRTENNDEMEDGPPVVVWNQRAEPFSAINETHPVINVGLPRSGEDTLWNFFSNLGYATQYGCGDMKKPRPGCLGMGCVKQNLDEGRPLLEGCSLPSSSDDAQDRNSQQTPTLQVYTQLDSVRYLVTRKPVMVGQTMPQMHHLEELYQYAPHATWILPLHLPEHWAYTLSRHHTLRKRLWNEVFVEKHKAKPPLRNRHILQPELQEVAAVDFWTDYYKNHTQHIREFAKQHPSLRVVEVQIRMEQQAPQELMSSLGLSLPKNNRKITKVSDAYQCMRNECDLWEDNVDSINHIKVTPRPEMKLPKPIFFFFFPKSGTTSVFNFFSCAGAVSQHYCCCGDVSDHRPCYTAEMSKCILENKENGRPMLEGCGEYDVYAQMDGERTFLLETGDGIERKAGHFLPQVFDLDLIHKEYPNATFILPLRDSDTWAKSVSRWFNMRHRIRTEYILQNRTRDLISSKPLVSIYERHTQNVIQFVKNHPSHKLIKFHITQPDAGKLLADESGLPESCWGHHNQNNRPRKY